MELEKQVVSLELAKKLKELKFEERSLFYWVVLEVFKDKIEFVPQIMISSDIGGYNQNHNGQSRYAKIAPAYTTAELGEMLPVSITKKRITYFLEMDKNSVPYFVWGVHYTEYQEDGSSGWLNEQNFLEESEADARAKMLIYLKENNLI